MHIVGLYVGLDLFGGDPSAVAFDQFDRGTSVKRDPPTFVLIDVCIHIADDFIARLGMAFDGDLVGHGARGAKQPAFKSEIGSRFRFEFIDGGVFAKDIIPDRSLVNG